MIKAFFRRKRQTALLIALGLWAQLAWTARADVLELRNGDLLQGDVVSVSEEAVTMRLKEGTQTTLALRDLAPSTVYRLKASRIARGDAQAHLRLGEYCLSEELFGLSRREFVAAMEVSPALGDLVAKKLAEVDEREARLLYEQGLEAMQKERYQDAIRRWEQLIQRFPESSWSFEARKTMRAAAEAMSRDNEQSQALLDALKRKLATVSPASSAPEKPTKLASQPPEKSSESAAEQAGEPASASEAPQNVPDQIRTLLETSRRLYRQGLEQETQAAPDRAEAAWKQALEQLDIARQMALSEAEQAGPTPSLRGGGAGEPEEIFVLRIACSNNLAQLMLGQNRLQEALGWANQTLLLEPENEMALRVKLLVREAELRAATEKPANR